MRSTGALASLLLALALPTIALSAVACRSSHPPIEPTELDAGDGLVDAGEDAEDRDAGSDAGRDRPDIRVRIGTFNVRRYFDTICDSGMCASGDFEAAPSEMQFTSRTNQIAGAIRRLDADIVLLQEVEKRSCLDALRAALSPLYSSSAFGETGTDPAFATVDVGVLSNLPLLDVVTHRHEDLYRPDGSRTRFSRELLEVHFDAGGGARVIVFVAHFKSKDDDDPGRRLAEAQASYRIIGAATQEHPDALVVFGGDLNDDPPSQPMQALLSSGRLLRAAADLPVADQATVRYRGMGYAYDHLLVDTQSAGAYTPASTRVIRDGSAGLGGSDHAAVVAEFGFRY